MLKAYRYEIYPTKEQADEISRWFGAVRWTYNWGLEQKIKSYNETKKTESYFDLSVKLTDIKKKEEYKWLNDVYSQSLNMSLRNLISWASSIHQYINTIFFIINLGYYSIYVIFSYNHFIISF